MLLVELDALLDTLPGVLVGALIDDLVPYPLRRKVQKMIWETAQGGVGFWTLF